MYVLSLENGYTMIEGNVIEGYDIIEYEGGIKEKIKIRNRAKTIEIMPIGQIVMDSFNREWDKYKADGGKRMQAMPYGKKSLTAPYCPEWFYPDKKVKEYSISDIDFENDPHYTNVTYIQFMGQLTPVFKVSDISELYQYDLYRMKAAGTQLRQCSECGRAFLASTTGKYCSKCRNAGVREKKKRDNLMGNPTRRTFHQIKDRNNHTNRMGMTYKYYYANLCNLIQEHTDNDTPEDLSDFATMLNDLDKRFFALCKYFNSETYWGDEELLNKWNHDKTQFPLTENPVEWIEDWESVIDQ